MTLNGISFLIVLTLVTSGCRVRDNLYRTLVYEPHQYDSYFDEIVTKRRFGKLAREALSDYPGQSGSKHFACGFVDGFVDHLEAGGNCDPQSLPPRQYWKAEFQTVQGHRAVEKWFQGFEVGARQARDSGLRELVEIPCKLLPTIDPEYAAMIQNEYAPIVPAEQFRRDEHSGKSNSIEKELLPPPHPTLDNEVLR